ncbi:MAG: hypothetical protein HEQ17_04755 [Limnohabitans sp.]|jgi:hypothetical protein|uniref:hypothetical protein n=1 Tax=Limnohabitans sp. TaxID=1907725 RepID=UPI0025F66C90|nr:hypothetical protein [Limnohabitans sp.]MCO4088278.1 hypothetical protein [Limnohabitans sp.]
MTEENLGEYKDAHGNIYIVLKRTATNLFTPVSGTPIKRPGKIELLTECGQALNWTDKSPQEFELLNRAPIYKAS